ncbi:MAG: hypothetical protein JSV79_14255 [Armatimonadota bacterium]|nr:MAG: hypothetical protein JSV79_14255 [Armatimonadota bacterium]
MARRNVRRGSTERRDSTTYYVSSDSDRRYAADAHRRVKWDARRAWAIRLLVLAVVAFLAWTYGPDLWSLVSAKAGATAQDFKQVGEHIHSGAERRAGSELEESP